MKLNQQVIWRNRRMNHADMKNILKQSGIDTRRLSRQSLIALSALMCLPETRLPEQTALLLGVSFSSVSLMRKMRQNVAQNVAMPLDLLASLHNAPAFQAAKALQLRVAGQVCAVWHAADEWQTPVRAAQRLFALGLAERALIGWVYESHDEHDEYDEGAIWLDVSADEAAPVFRLPETASAHPPLTHYFDRVEHWLSVWQAGE